MAKYKISDPYERINFILDKYDNNKWCVWRFCDSNHEKQKEHYYIVVPLYNNDFLLVCLITSKVAKREKHYRKRQPSLFENLVRVGKAELDCLSVDSIIDCNTPLYISKDDFRSSMFDLSIVDTTIKEELKSKILAKINASPVVKLVIKEAINKKADG